MSSAILNADVARNYRSVIDATITNAGVLRSKVDTLAQGAGDAIARDQSRIDSFVPPPEGAYSIALRYVQDGRRIDFTV